MTRDFSALPGGRVVLGIRSEASRVKVEFHDKDNHSDVYITGVEPGVEKFCSIPVSALKGIDISRVRAVLFGVEREANPGSIDIRADVLGVRDFTVPAPTGGELFASSAPNDAATASWTGDHAIRISTSGSFTYCVTGGFTYPGEGANLVRNEIRRAHV